MIYNGRYTIENSKGEYRTFQIRTQAQDAGFAPGKRIVGLLSGPDNINDYSNFAFLNENGTLSVWQKKRTPIFAHYAYLLEVLLGGKPNTKRLPLTRYKVHEQRRCLRCNAVLTTPESIEAGIGPVCAGR